MTDPHPSSLIPHPSSWRDAKTLGDAAEEAVALALLELRGGEALRTVGPASFDVELRTRFEVKWDRQAVRTGRVAIEMSFSGRPAGLAISPADWWVFVIGEGAAGEAWMLPTAELRALVDEYPNAYRGGDDNRTLVRLVPLAALRARARLLRVKLPAEKDEG